MMSIFQPSLRFLRHVKTLVNALADIRTARLGCMVGYWKLDRLHKNHNDDLKAMENFEKWILAILPILPVLS